MGKKTGKFQSMLDIVLSEGISRWRRRRRGTQVWRQCCQPHRFDVGNNLKPGAGGGKVRWQRKGWLVVAQEEDEKTKEKAEEETAEEKEAEVMA